MGSVPRIDAFLLGGHWSLVGGRHVVALRAEDSRCARMGRDEVP